MAVLEAIASGKAVSDSRIGGISEQIEDDRTGFLFEMGNLNKLQSLKMFCKSDTN